MKANRSNDIVKTLYKNKDIDGLFLYAKNNPTHRSKAIAYAKRLKRKAIRKMVKS